MKAKLNATTIKGLTPKDKPYEVVDTEIKGFLLRVQPSGTMTYYFSYRSKTSKLRHRIKIGVVAPGLKPALARAHAKNYDTDVTNGKDPQLEKVKTQEEAKEARQRKLNVFLQDHYKPWAKSNLRDHEGALARIEHHFDKFMDLPLEDLTIRRVEQWRTRAQKQGLAASTINRTVNCLRGVLTRAVAWNYLPSHPLEGLKPLKVDKAPKVRYLSDDEEDRLYAALEARDQRIKTQRANGNRHRAARGYPLLPDLAKYAFGDRLTPMVILSLKTGLRRGELFDLKKSDVDLDSGLLTIRGEDSKSGHTRHIPLSPKTQKVVSNWLKQHLGDSKLMFPADGGERLDNIRTSWGSVLKAAEIANFRWHDIRHDFASKLVMRGVPLNTVRELCGHADMNTTLRYAHLAPHHKAEAVAVLD